MDNFNNNFTSQVDNINIANGHPEYVGTGIIFIDSSKSKDYDYYDDDSGKHSRFLTIYKTILFTIGLIPLAQFLYKLYTHTIFTKF